MFKTQNLILGMFITILIAGIGLGLTKANSAPIKKDMIFMIDENTDTNKLKKLVKVRHEMPNWISGSVKESDLEEAQALAQASEEVGYYQIQNMGPFEDIVEPGRNRGPRKPGDRVCTPEEQVWINVEHVNGGETQNGGGVKVAVLDTGSLTDHPDLEVFLCKDATGGGIEDGCEDDFPGGHGTRVLGIVSANAGIDRQGLYGVAPSAQGWALKVCDNYGSCRWDDIARAVEYAADQGVNIINMSLGGSAPSMLLLDVIREHPEVLFVSITGNFPGYNKILYPGAWKEVIAVGGILDDKSFLPFSSQGINDGDYIIEDREVEFAAVGYRVLSLHSNKCYAKANGTSFAAPTIAGLAAKLWHEGGNSAEEVREYMHTLVEDLDVPGDDPKTGFGLPVAP